jgi:hypothetical protein
MPEMIRWSFLLPVDASTHPVVKGTTVAAKDHITAAVRDFGDARLGVGGVTCRAMGFENGTECIEVRDVAGGCRRNATFTAIPTRRCRTSIVGTTVASCALYRSADFAALAIS